MKAVMLNNSICPICKRQINVETDIKKDEQAKA
jgi:hypothetical protein